jgi:hypothetical protein
MLPLTLVLGWLCVVVLVFVAWQGRLLRRLWREPILRHPVLVIESDDWGPGPDSDGEALRRVADVLGSHRDSSGRPATMTLGLLLAVPDTRRQKQHDTYRRALISDDRFRTILDAIQGGIATGVFSPQLHGMEHYWPDAIRSAARIRDDVREWLVQRGVPRTEDLPSPLQSRWIDASQLPSRALPNDAVAAAARQEVEAFAEVFGTLPHVVVPPTFVWTESVEAAWAANGVRFLVTPGMHYVGRDDEGKLVGRGECIWNGKIGPSGIAYLVRDDYFEPALGHDAKRALRALLTKARAGRPTLLETHRFNFTNVKVPLRRSLDELDRLLDLARQTVPDVRFMSTRELGDAIVRRDTRFVEITFVRRVRTWLVRAWQTPRLRKLAWGTGAVVPGFLLYWVIEAIPVGIQSSAPAEAA